MLRNVFFIYILLVLSLTPEAWSNTSAHTFRHEMQNHRFRLYRYALVVVDQFPQHFGDLSPELIKHYFEFHDKPKIQDIDDILRFGYSDRHSISERLSHFHGLNFSNLSETEKNELKTIINELNRIEELEKKEFFDRENLSEDTIRKLAWLEKIVDITDVGIYRVKEMGLEDKLWDGALFLKNRSDRVGAFISHWLEKEIRNKRIQQKSCKKIW